jgi:putative flippase GtrA
MGVIAMTWSARWWRFNAVGAIGFAVQMGALVLLRRICGGHYLLASALALELTLVHNFLWHLRFTWRDRYSESSIAQFTRFQLSNGMISLAGNLGMVRLLVRDAHVPLVAANATAVLICAAANFYVGDVWAFAARRDVCARSLT